MALRAARFENDVKLLIDFCKVRVDEMGTSTMTKRNMAAGTFPRSYTCVIVLLAAVSCSYGVAALPLSQVEGLLTLRELLQNPSATATWNNNTSFCNLPPSPHVYIICSAPETLTYLRIVGDKNVATLKDKQGSSQLMNKSLPSSFSATTLVATLLAFPELRALELTNVGMWGNLPENLAQMSNLQVLNVSSNLFTGAIPKTLRKLTGLRVLAMDNNAIAGSFPYWLNVIPTLETLSLSNNCLTGELNDSMISGFKNLRLLSLSNNLFSGAIPGAIASLPNLQILSLAHNHFTGAIPKMETLRNLKVLNLGGNSLGPSFPAMGAQLVEIRVGQNKLSGVFPDSLKGFVELQTLDVSGNAMAGTPPSFLFTLPRISSLNVARNHFSGVLPANLTLGKSLSSLDVSGNFFSGPPPVVFLSAARNVVIHFQSNCMETLKQKQGSVEYCTETAAKLGIEKPHIHSHLVLIIVVAAAGGLCLSVALCVLVVLVVRRCGNEKDSVAAPEDGNFGSFRGIPSELLSNASMIIQHPL